MSEPGATGTVAKTSSLVGRDRERTALLEVLEQGGPRLVFIHGPGGIGKTALLADLCTAAERAGASVLRLDCRWIEPTPGGFLAALGSAAGTEIPDLATATSAFRSARATVIGIDTYELFRLSDDWLRHALLPALPAAVRLVIAGREPPIATWSGAQPWHEIARSIRLGPLGEADALSVLEIAGVSASDAKRINKVARGHPLSLQVATMAVREQPDLAVEETALPRVVEQLTTEYLGHLDPGARRPIEAASVVRRVTAGLVTAMLPEVDAAAVLHALSSLPFVDSGPDGLRLHEAVQTAVADRLRALDPDAYRRYASAAWRVLRTEVRDAPRADLWRYTADMLYLLQNPNVREAFFPTTEHLYAIADAAGTERDDIFSIVGSYLEPPAAAVIEAWWDADHTAFRVIRDRSGSIVGFSVIGRNERAPASLAARDPVLAAWRDHLLRHPLPSGQRALFDRCTLDRDTGGAPSPVQAAAWLDIKRVYMELRPNVGRLYATSTDPTPYLEAMQTLGFVPFPAPVDIGGTTYHLASLTFGPGSVDEWLARLAAAELGVMEEGMLDPANHEVVLDGSRIRLSHLEFGVLQHLMSREGKAVPRAELLERVWGHTYEGGSNVVDAVVRTLRKKLGARASMIDTVRGVGYRFRP